MLHGTDALRIIFADDRELVADKIPEVFDKGMAEVDARLLGRDGWHDFWFTGRRQGYRPMSSTCGKRGRHHQQQPRSRLSVLAKSGIAVWYSFHRTQFSINHDNRFTFANPSGPSIVRCFLRRSNFGKVAV